MPLRHQRRAVLAGTDRQPEVRLFFHPTDVHPWTGVNLIEWVKKAPGRRWNPDLGCWAVTGFGPKDPESVLRRAGFEIELHPTDLDPSLANILNLEDLKPPLCRQSTDRPTTALVRPRFAGWEMCRDLLGPAARWDKETGRFEVPLTDLLRHGDPKPGLVIDPATVAAAREMLKRSAFNDDEEAEKAATVVAASTGLDLTEADDAAVAKLVDVVGEIPEWFGFTPYPYQRLGTLAACAGRNFVADEMGLGKTITALAVMALRGSTRAVVLVPPVVLTNWEREAVKAGLGVPAPRRRAKAKRSKKADGPGASPIHGKSAAPGPGQCAHGQDPRPVPPSTDAHATTGVSIVTHDPQRRHIVQFRAGRKEPELPDAGIAIIADSLLASRPELSAKLAGWAPDLLVYDEAHRARNWDSKRSTTVRDLCERLPRDTLRLPLTGTPLFSNPAELAPLLAISGHLGPVFGGYEAFVDRYCERNYFKALVPREDRLPELKRILSTQVWVRRHKSEVQSDLPKVARSAVYVDVDLSGYRAAHDDVIDKVSAWLDAYHAEHNCWPNDDARRAYARQQIGLVSPLRKAAGLAKVSVTLDRISAWLDEQVQINADGSFTCDRPLLVWAHHTEVVSALAEHVKEHFAGNRAEMIRVIDGATSATRRTAYVDAYQDGRLPVLVCSITAAGVGITLTRGCDQWFVELDPSVPLMRQAEDRQNRIGQKRPVSISYILSPQTLDSRYYEILQEKGAIIDAVTGSSITEDLDFADMSTRTASEIISDLIEVALDRLQTSRKKAA